MDEEKLREAIVKAVSQAMRGLSIDEVRRMLGIRPEDLTEELEVGELHEYGQAPGGLEVGEERHVVDQREEPHGQAELLLKAPPRSPPSLQPPLGQATPS